MQKRSESDPILKRIVTGNEKWVIYDNVVQKRSWSKLNKLACDHSMPRRGHGRTGDSMYWWNDQLSVLRRQCLVARRRYTRSKGDSLLQQAWKKAKLALRQGIKILVLRRKTPGLDNPDRVKYIVRSLFPHVEPFQRQDQSSCVVRREEFFPLEELKRAGGRLKANTAPGIDGHQSSRGCLLI